MGQSLHIFLNFDIIFIMEKEPLIVPPQEKLRSAQFYLVKEMQDDLGLFPEHVQVLVKKWLNGESLKNEGGHFAKAQCKWWYEKYGFPFANKVARDEVLIRKYNPENTKEAHSLQWDLLHAILVSDDKKVGELKKKYQEEYPDQMEAVEVIFGIKDFIEKSRNLNLKHKELTGKEKIDAYRDITEYQFLFTHFVIQNHNDRKFLELFWNIAEEIARKMGAEREINMLRRAQVSQTAVYRIMEELGENPKLSHPDEDAFESVDLWESSEKAVQIKGWEEQVPAIFTSDEISFPAIRADQKMTSKFYSSAEYMGKKNTIFRAKIKEYGDRLGKHFEGYMLVVPYSKIDFVNGEPAPELVEFFREKLKSNVEAQKAA